MGKNNRILIIGDDAKVRNYYKRILSSYSSPNPSIIEKDTSHFGKPPQNIEAVSSKGKKYDLTLIENGKKGVSAVEMAIEQSMPFAMAFIDIKISGIDVAEMVNRIWVIDPNIKIIIVTAFSKCTINDIKRISGRKDYFYLDKPLVSEEIRQFACALTYQWNLERELERKNKILTKQAINDSLTNIYNHRYIIERLSSEIAEAKRYSLDLSIVMFDVDHFKRINDTYGHQTGDQVLVKISSTIRDSLRQTDIIGRYGGEEFLVILPHTNIEDAYTSAERLGKNIEDLNWDKGFKITISGGLISRKDQSASDLIMKADALLHKAKENGRNRIEVG